MDKKERMQTTPEVILAMDQKSEAADLMRTIMEELDQQERQRMADFLRGIRFARVLGGCAV